MTREEFVAEYTRLGHAIQSGVALDMQHDTESTEPKHLRTGLNLVMCDTAALGELLIRKGILTEDEYFGAILQGLVEEKARYEQHLSASLGTTVVLA